MLQSGVVAVARGKGRYVQCKNKGYAGCLYNQFVGRDVIMTNLHSLCGFLLFDEL